VIARAAAFLACTFLPDTCMLLYINAIHLLTHGGALGVGRPRLIATRIEPCRSQTRREDASSMPAERVISTASTLFAHNPTEAFANSTSSSHRRRLKVARRC
jgi:hypothetical protein